MCAYIFTSSTNSANLVELKHFSKQIDSWTLFRVH
jgi:hypothetical protein